jgi:hypothetical protein
MTDEGYPAKEAQRRIYQRIERHAVLNSSCAVCTTPGTARMYEARFPEVPKSRFSIIGNGYDEENFSAARRDARALQVLPARTHSRPRARP